MRKAAALTALLLFAGFVVLYLAHGSMTRRWEEKSRSEARLLLLRAKEQARSSPEEAERLLAALAARKRQGLAQHPDFQFPDRVFASMTPKDFQAEAPLETQEESGITRGAQTLYWRAWHIPEAAAALLEMETNWNAVLSNPPPLGVERCAFRRESSEQDEAENETLAVSCRVSWQYARLPEEFLRLDRARDSARNAAPARVNPQTAPSFGRIFFTPEERRLRDQARHALNADSRWQGRISRSGVKDALVWKNGAYARIRGEESGEVGGATRDLLRGGEIVRREKP
ncbi:MAG: hypothetical protein LBG69_03665 [Zoogloeaceae bacterium]|jgi:hypothetical protein|nr:hypothetical protein [Zoogloeaceae bacterium]